MIFPTRIDDIWRLQNIWTSYIWRSNVTPRGYFGYLWVVWIPSHRQQNYYVVARVSEYPQSTLLWRDPIVRTRIPRSVPGRYLGRIDPMFQISRHLSVESSPKVSKAGPGSIHVLRPNSVSDFQYRPVLDVRSVGSVPRSNPASTWPESITGDSEAEDYLKNSYNIKSNIIDQRG